MKDESVALITGASSGIGKELAKLLDEKGFSLILAGRDEKSLHGEFKGNVSYVVGDLAKPEEREKIIAEIERRVPKLIINNAGFGVYGDAVTCDIKEQMKILEVNAAALMEITLRAAKSLIEKGKKGVILNVSSVAGELAMPGMGVYGASKSFVTMFSKALDAECRGKGVRVLVSLPGQVKTAFSTRAAKKKTNTSKKNSMSASFAAEEIWKQIEKEKAVHIFDGRYRIFLWIAKHLIPEKIIEKIIYQSIQKRL